MPKAFSLASWNVEHFRDHDAGRPQRIQNVATFLAAQDADVFAVYECEGRDMFWELMDRMPGYHMHITEGENTQEILVGVRNGLSAFSTQRLEFNTGNPSLRPGSLLTVRKDGTDYTLLFLHTKSGPDPAGLGLRQEMLARAIDLKKHLDAVHKARGKPGVSNFLFLGDLNTMGMRDPPLPTITPEKELENLDQEAGKAGMRRLAKDQPKTFSNPPPGGLQGDLDHVVASSHLAFRKWGPAEVQVRGWPQQPTDPAKAAWIRAHSDHALLYFELQKA